MKLTHRDLTDLRSRAITHMASLSPRRPIEGTPPGGLSLQDMQAIAWLEASLYLLGQKGMLNGVDGPLFPQGDTRSVWEE